MKSEAITVTGVVRGKLIELEHDSGLPDGQTVRVTVEPTRSGQNGGERLSRAFGAWAEDSEQLSAYLEWNRQQRRRNRKEFEP